MAAILTVMYGGELLYLQIILHARFTVWTYMCMRTWFESTQERQLKLNKIAWLA